MIAIIMIGKVASDESVPLRRGVGEIPPFIYHQREVCRPFQGQTNFLKQVM